MAKHLLYLDPVYNLIPRMDLANVDTEARAHSLNSGWLTGFACSVTSKVISLDQETKL